MKDYFDDVEQQLRDAVPRAARAHRSHFGIVRTSFFRLSALLIAIALPLALVLLLVTAFSGGSGHVAPRAHLNVSASAHSRTNRRRPPRSPNPLSLLKALVALRRPERVALPQLRTIRTALRTARPASVTSLLSFAAATAGLGVQSALVASRRPRAHPPDQRSGTGSHACSTTRPLPCSARVHARPAAAWSCAARDHTAGRHRSPARVSASRGHAMRVAA